METRVGAAVALVVGAAVASAAAVLLAASPLVAGLLGVVYGLYGWALWG